MCFDVSNLQENESACDDRIAAALFSEWQQKGAASYLQLNSHFNSEPQSYGKLTSRTREENVILGYVSRQMGDETGGLCSLDL